MFFDAFRTRYTQDNPIDPDPEYWKPGTPADMDFVVGVVGGPANFAWDRTRVTLVRLGHPRLARRATKAAAARPKGA